jgi:hypothetical protein
VGAGTASLSSACCELSPPAQTFGGPRRRPPSSPCAEGSGSGKSRLLSKTAAALAAVGVRVARDRREGAAESTATFGAVRRLLSMLEGADDRVPTSGCFPRHGARGGPRRSLRPSRRYARGARLEASNGPRSRRLRSVRRRRVADVLLQTRSTTSGRCRRDAEGRRCLVLLSYDPGRPADERLRAFWNTMRHPRPPPSSRSRRSRGERPRFFAKAAAPDIDDPAAVATLVAEAGRESGRDRRGTRASPAASRWPT